MSQQVNVVIVSEYQLFRECLASVLNTTSEFSAVPLDCDKDRIFKCLDSIPSGIALLKSDFAQQQLIELIAATTNRFPGISVLVLGTTEPESSIAAYLEAGAKGYIPREASLAELMPAISKVVNGEVVCSNRAALFMVGKLADLCSKNRRLRQIESLTLTFRELGILELIASGLSNEQIGVQLSISVHTVKNHVHNILDKLQLGSRVQAVQHAYEKKWLRVGFSR